MDHIVEFLNERGYLARWEPDEHGDIDVLLEPIDTDAESDAPAAVTYLLHKCHCPYSGIEAESNELCQMDQALIEYLLGQSCERINTIAENAPCCTYRIVTPIDKSVESVESLASVESVEESVTVPSA